MVSSGPQKIRTTFANYSGLNTEKGEPYIKCFQEKVPGARLESLSTSNCTHWPHPHMVWAFGSLGTTSDHIPCTAASRPWGTPVPRTPWHMASYPGAHRGTSSLT